MPSRTIGSLIVRMGWDPKDVDKGLKTFEKNLKDTGRRMESVGKTMSIGFTAPFLYGISKAIKAYDEEAQVVKKLEVALGGASKALLAQAAAIQKTTIYSDDSVISIQAYAAALGHSEAEIGKMTTAAVGLAAGLGISLEDAMAKLHKTTLGTSKGLGTLIPGVKELSAEQLKAGAAIDIVNAKFGGYAETLAKTGAGPLKVFQNRFGDLMEQFGEAALPLLNKIIDKFSQLTDWFSKLSPETKSLAVNIGAIVALSGPVLLMAGSLIKMTTAVSGLVTALKGLAMVGGGLPAILAAMAVAAHTFDHNFNPTGVGGNAQTFAGNVASWAAKKSGFQPKAASYGGTDMLLGTAALGAQNSGFLAPPKLGALGGNGGGGGGGSLIGTFSGIARSLERITLSLTPFRANGAAGMSSIQPNLSPAMAGNVGNGGLATLSGIGGHGEAMAGMMSILPNMEPVIAGHTKSVDMLKMAYQGLGEGVGGAVSEMITAFAEGANGFAAFGKSALSMAAQVVKAMLAVVLAKATARAAEGGPIGAVIGLGIAIGVVEAMQGMISKIKTPKLAQGGVVQGPQLVTMGDNPSGKEMALPWEKTHEFASMIGRHMGGGGFSGEIVMRGDDLHLAVKKAQDRSIRRGSANTIVF